ncbi:MAG: LamG domain-containing protein, partial [Parcubacteria group bacterium]|nr:LamG domain-containing protein [Parcubacteria group bacterium]
MFFSFKKKFFKKSYTKKLVKLFLFARKKIFFHTRSRAAKRSAFQFVTLSVARKVLKPAYRSLRWCAAQIDARLIQFSLFIALIAVIITGVFFTRTIYLSLWPSAYEAKGSSTDNQRGWAWSDTSGWVSMNCYNDFNSDGAFETQCVAGATSTDYGVHYSSASSSVSGYGWSDNSGWFCFGSTCSTTAPDGQTSWMCVGKLSGGNCIADCGANFNVTNGNCGNTNSILHWKMDSIAAGGTITDFSSSGFTGTLKPQYATSSPILATGKFSNGLLFDGSDDYLQADDASSLDLQNTNFTIDTWFRMESKPATSSTSTILSKRDSSGTNQYAFELYNNNGTTSAWCLLGSLAMNATDSLAVNAWHHLGCTYATSTGGAFYLDGVQKVTSTTTTIPNTTGKLYIASSSSGGGYFNGVVDNVAIFIEARTAEQLWDDSHTEISGWAQVQNLGTDGFIKLKGTSTAGTYFGVDMMQFSDYYWLNGWSWNDTYGWVQFGYPTISTPPAFGGFNITNGSCDANDKAS